MKAISLIKQFKPKVRQKQKHTQRSKRNANQTNFYNN